MQHLFGPICTGNPIHSRMTLLNARLLQLALFVSYIFTLTNASPISAPDSNNKSGQNSGSTSSSYVIKPSAHDVQLNSLNAYAINYGQMVAESSHNAAAAQNADVNFKPSYKLNEVENNFTPIQTHNSGNAGGIVSQHAAPLNAITPNVKGVTANNIQQQATPVLMQYLSPHTVPEAGVHYLQLIPTRPLIVPISSYLNGNSAPQAAQTPLHPPLAAAINAGPLDYAARTPTILAPEPVNNNVGQQQQQQKQQHPLSGGATTLIDVSHTAAAQPYGLQTYANAIQPYRGSYRINREVKGKNHPGTMSLNMNEYIPGPNETLRPVYIRGRP